MTPSRLVASAAAAALLLGLTACSTGAGTRPATSTPAASGDGFPVTIPNAFGSTTIERRPVRVATVGWANDEVPLALGVVPVGMAKATWGDDDGDGVLPWVETRLTQLKAEAPVLFDETDGPDFEAVADTRPDVILAAYSGLTKAQYETLSKIAPVVSYPDLPWGTSLTDTVLLDSEALGLKAKGEALVASLDARIASAAKAQPAIAGKTAMFAYIDPNDLGTVGFYTTHDPRAAFFTQLGMRTPKAVAAASAKTREFYTTVSAEDADAFRDVDVIVTYGDSTLLARMRADPLLSKIPAVARGAVVVLPNSTPLAASANPSPLSVGWGIGKYVGLLGAAAAKGA